MNIDITVSNKHHTIYAEEVCALIEESAKIRGTGIAKRDPEYIRQKMENGNAVIALSCHKLAGFCYIETWKDEQYIAFSGLIVHADFRRQGLARNLTQVAFKLARHKFPDSKIFLITTSRAVMKVGSKIGYEPVTFSELPDDDHFWEGCESCPNYDILTRTGRKHCLCTGMLYEPKEKS